MRWWAAQLSRGVAVRPPPAVVSHFSSASEGSLQGGHEERDGTVYGYEADAQRFASL